jgi:murein DD-endopeptidase MepM/ murein hydrolase activator NlpD
MCRYTVILALFFLLTIFGCTPNNNLTNYYLNEKNIPTRSFGQAYRGAGVIIQVKSGDTLYAISKKHNVTLRDLIEGNDLQPPFEIFIGQKLKLKKPITHTILAGDTVFSLSLRYGVDMRTLVSINSLRPPYQVKPGDEIMIPGRERSEKDFEYNVKTIKSSSAKSVPFPRWRPSRKKLINQPANETFPVSNVRKRNSLPSPEARSSGRFLWPAKGRIISNFGPRLGGLHNDGINIAAPLGTPIFAAENGVVAYVGNGLKGFGNLILLKHAEGWTTAYAHTDKTLVKRGTHVKRGEKIGTVGKTGGVSKPQLHFEVRKGARAIDPKKELAI